MSLQLNDLLKIIEVLPRGPMNPFKTAATIVDKNSVANQAFSEVTGTSIGDQLGSYLNTQTGAGLTGRDKALMQWQENMSNTAHQREAADLEAAGYNPALTVGSPTGSSTPSSPSASSSASMSELAALATLPLQIKQLRADIANTEANTNYLEQKRKTEEQVTKLKAIMVEWQPTINAESVAKLSAEVDRAQAEITLAKSKTDFVESQNEAQRITNSVLSEKLRAEINSDNARARQAAASAALLKVQADYAEQHQCLMSSNDFVVIASYIAHLFGTSPENIVKSVTEYISSGELKNDFQPWKKVSGDEAMDWFVSHANNAAAN